MGSNVMSDFSGGGEEIVLSCLLELLLCGFSVDCRGLSYIGRLQFGVV